MDDAAPDTDTPNHADRAIRATATENWQTAGEQYTLAAYGTLAGHEGFRREAFDGERTSAGTAVCHLVRAGLCYRLAGVEAAARNRAMQGALLAVDQKRVRDGVDAAACDELLGHCRTLASEAERATEAYDRAAAGYAAADVDDPAGATTRPLLQAGTDLVTHLSRPDDVGWDDIHGTGGDALQRRVRFVRSRVRELLAARVEARKLYAPRGSTEYGVDRFTCPDCGSHDVNYVAETVLCLRCNAVVEERS
ncbi:hypothetical protein [Salinigranum rubrum]|uniref:hypothetical protein n=1 Tax=Salinigranum rubrum TaxID=755307 RepID=UPI001FED10AE|nr:hypothetical protein [Salinigranum rubrum]